MPLPQGSMVVSPHAKPSDYNRDWAGWKRSRVKAPFRSFAHSITSSMSSLSTTPKIMRIITCKSGSTIGPQRRVHSACNHIQDVLWCLAVRDVVDITALWCPDLDSPTGVSEVNAGYLHCHEQQPLLVEQLIHSYRHPSKELRRNTGGDGHDWNPGGSDTIIP